MNELFSSIMLVPWSGIFILIFLVACHSGPVENVNNPIAKGDMSDSSFATWSVRFKPETNEQTREVFLYNMEKIIRDSIAGLIYRSNQQLKFSISRQSFLDDSLKFQIKADLLNPQVVKGNMPAPPKLPLNSFHIYQQSVNFLMAIGDTVRPPRPLVYVNCIQQGSELCK